MTEAFSLANSIVHLPGVGHIGRVRNSASLWKGPGRAELHTGHVLSVFTYLTTWDFEERHPDGDELAVVLDGDIDLILDADAGETGVHVGTGLACVIPAGAWHRVAVRQPSTVLFVTPVPARTEHRTIDAHLAGALPTPPAVRGEA